MWLHHSTTQMPPSQDQTWAPEEVMAALQWHSLDRKQKPVLGCQDATVSAQAVFGRG